MKKQKPLIYSCIKSSKVFLFITLTMLLTGFVKAQNTNYGTGTLQNNTSGNGNAAFGYQAMYSNTTGDSNSAHGMNALRFNTTGSQNTATGFNALRSNTTGSFNNAHGLNALYFNTAGYNNCAMGYRALYYNTTGYANATFGNNSLFLNTEGFNNAAIGWAALHDNTTGQNNTASGANGLYENVSGRENTSTGAYALFRNTTGNFNTAIGIRAGYYAITGSGNIFIGAYSGSNETGSNKLYIGSAPNKTFLYGDISTGQLLLGQPAPTGYVFKGKRTLNVVGGVLADSVRIALSTEWADYVFADDYQLMSLSDLHKYIKTNKHLPNIPSGEEVSANGIEVGSMNAKLLEKIEELHIYLLQQQDQIKQQQKQIDELKDLIILQPKQKE